ncbi:TolB family protein [Tahibacter harae]|uniref:WD40 repeat protein n=1 Tax=Tahibacter harae TaxID=2963937 RepID=A0ABT1QYS9_9GAMM|nr:hypothetical protein [Tahibacter harae]MCQ4167454.1 hypothetical protein [Tahibacter harae]
MNKSPRLALLLPALLASTAAQALSATAPQLASRAPHGDPTYGPCGFPKLSSNGQFIAFSCASDDLLAGDTNERYDVFLLNRRTSVLQRVSLNAANTEQRNHADVGFPSTDGSQVVFLGQGMFHPDVRGDENPNGDATVANVFLRNLTVPSTEMLSRGADGGGNPGGRTALLQAANLRRQEVLFSSSGNFLASAPQILNDAQLFARSWRTGQIELISARPDGQISQRSAGNASWSGDGRFVVFQSNAADLTHDNPLEHRQLFLRDRLAGTTQRLTRPWNGGEFPTGSIFYGKPSLSHDGRYIVFMAGLVDGITPDDNPGVSDIYLFDRHTRTTQLVTRSRDNVASDGWAYSPDISNDGRVVAYFSRATNMLPGISSTPAVYVEDRLTGELIAVSSTLAPPFGNFVPQIDLSEDGRKLAFSWQADDTADPSLRRRYLIYVVDLNGLEPPASRAAAVPSTSPRALLVIASLLAAVSLCVLAERRRGGRLARRQSDG